MHGRATRTRAWCGHVHAHGKDMHVRVATNRAGILLAIMRPGQLKRRDDKTQQQMNMAVDLISQNGNVATLTDIH